MDTDTKVALAEAEAERREHISKAMQALDIARDELWQASQVPAGPEGERGMIVVWHQVVCQLWYWLRPYGSRPLDEPGGKPRQSLRGA